MLADGQDPNALEARLAYHLHRLRLSGAPLRQALGKGAKTTTALSQGRVSVSLSYVTELALALNIATDELTRELTHEEADNWRFYRTSAQNQQAVWDKAVSFARRNNRSLRDMASIIAMNQPDMQFAVSGKRPRIFELEHARRLTSITTPPADPYSLLPDATDADHDRG